MILWVGVYNTPNLLQPGPKLLFKSLDLIHSGPLNGTQANKSDRHLNLLKVAGFEDVPVGPYAPASETCAIPAGMAADIMADGSHVLHLSWTNAAPAYVRLDARRVAMANCGVELSYRVRGRGTLQPMIWYTITDSGRWSYYGGKPVTLTEEWQTVRMWRGCVWPHIESAAGVIGMPAGTDVYVDDVDLRLVTVPK